MNELQPTAAIPGRFSDGEAIILLDGRRGLVTKSLGHTRTVIGDIMDPSRHQLVKKPITDPTKGPAYEVLINGRVVLHDRQREVHGDEYVTVFDEEIQ